MPSRLPRLFRPTPTNLARLAAVLRHGGIVGVPSETVYGLAADALDPAACAKIFEAKGRPTTDPLIVHLDSARALASVAHPNPAAEKLAAAFWPGPLTLVLPKKACVPDLVTAGKATVAVRVPAHSVFRRLIRLAGRPLAAPSANPFGYVSPTSAAHVRDGLAGTCLRAILDGGECTVGVESTIIDLSTPTIPRVLRPGGIAVEAIEAVLGCPIQRPQPKEHVISPGLAAPAPGMLEQHYSPRTPLKLHARLDAAALANLPIGVAALCLRRPPSSALSQKRSAKTPDGCGAIRWLSESGDLSEIARRLFSALRRFDHESWLEIRAEYPTGEEGLAPAIRDRLTRAAAKRVT